MVCAQRDYRRVTPVLNSSSRAADGVGGRGRVLKDRISRPAPCVRRFLQQNPPNPDLPQMWLLTVRCKPNVSKWRGLVLRICIRPLHGAFVLLAITYSGKCKSELVEDSQNEVCNISTHLRHHSL